MKPEQTGDGKIVSKRPGNAVFGAEVSSKAFSLQITFALYSGLIQLSQVR